MGPHVHAGSGLAARRIEHGRDDEQHDQQHRVLHAVPAPADDEPAVGRVNQQDPHGEFHGEPAAQRAHQEAEDERGAADNLHDRDEPGHRRTERNVLRVEEAPESGHAPVVDPVDAVNGEEEAEGGAEDDARAEGSRRHGGLVLVEGRQRAMSSLRGTVRGCQRGATSRTATIACTATTGQSSAPPKRGPSRRTEDPGDHRVVQRQGADACIDGSAPSLGQHAMAIATSATPKHRTTSGPAPDRSVPSSSWVTTDGASSDASPVTPSAAEENATTFAVTASPPAPGPA